MRTNWHRFVGLNIKGTPAMRASYVAHDLALAKSKASVVALQEFKWPWYWRTLHRMARKAEWGSFPPLRKALLSPDSSAQAVTWSKEKWRRRGVRTMLLHHATPGVSQARYLRAVLLEDRETGLRCWFGTTHFVVGGDERGDQMIRQVLMARDLGQLERFLRRLSNTGDPVIFQLDANIRPSSSVYGRFRDILSRRRATVLGRLGIEYLFIIQGQDSVIEVKNTWIIPLSKLRTDHEGRGVTFRIASRRK